MGMHGKFQTRDGIFRRPVVASQSGARSAAWEPIPGHADGSTWGPAPPPPAPELLEAFFVATAVGAVRPDERGSALLDPPPPAPARAAVTTALDAAAGGPADSEVGCLHRAFARFAGALGGRCDDQSDAKHQDRNDDPAAGPDSRAHLPGREVSSVGHRSATGVLGVHVDDSRSDLFLNLLCCVTRELNREIGRAHV